MDAPAESLNLPTTVEMRPHFTLVNGRRLFCVTRRRRGARPTTRLLLVPPFAEELNKCRRLMALCAQRLAAAGAEVWWPDLFGTGDSAGAFSDASWSHWVDDLCEIDAALAQSAPDAAPAYLALRSGALLLDAARMK